MMDGIPCSVSVVILTISTSLFHLLAYSTRKIAEKIPIGTASNRDNNVITTVLINAGMTDALSDVYLSANKSRLICGIPLIRIYAIKKINTRNVSEAQK